MYGMINKATQQMVVTQFGAEKWAEIKQKSKLDVEAFISMNQYPDELTYRLAAVASEVLELPLNQVLERLGEYWIEYTAQPGYGEMLVLAGDNFIEFLTNLDNLHARVGLSFPQLRPPSFRCTDITDDSLRLHYYSERPGLTHLVVGLLKGVGKMFGVETEVSIVNSRQNGHSHDEFFVVMRHP